MAGGMVAEKSSDWRFGGRWAIDALHVVDEAHVEHAVGLVEDEDLDLVEEDVLLLLEIEQPSGRGDEDVDAAVQRLNLAVLADAAEDDGVREAQVLAVMVEALADLRGELARGCEG